MTEAGETHGYDVDELEVAVDVFLAHLHDDLPPGPASELGDDFFDTKGLVTLPESEFRRRAAMGKALVDARITSREA